MKILNWVASNHIISLSSDLMSCTSVSHTASTSDSCIPPAIQNFHLYFNLTGWHEVTTAQHRAAAAAALRCSGPTRERAAAAHQTAASYCHISSFLILSLASWQCLALCLCPFFCAWTRWDFAWSPWPMLSDAVDGSPLCLNPFIHNLCKSSTIRSSISIYTSEIKHILFVYFNADFVSRVLLDWSYF